MTIVVDISCPSCGRSNDVIKVNLGTYRCMECEHEFGQEDVRPPSED